MNNSGTDSEAEVDHSRNKTKHEDKNEGIYSLMVIYFFNTTVTTVGNRFPGGRIARSGM